MFFVSVFTWLLAWLRPARRAKNHEARVIRGEPHPLGRSGCGVWLARLDDDEPWGYLVTDGYRPVAAIWHQQGEGGELTADDYLLARRIALRPQLAGKGEYIGIDLREVPVAVLLNELDGLRFLPADSHGHQRSDCPNYGFVYLHQNGKLAVCTMLEPQMRPTSTERYPSSEMNVNVGWTPVPAALKSHLDLIDPVNKNSGQVATDTLSPGQSESIEVATLTAA